MERERDGKREIEMERDGERDVCLFLYSSSIVQKTRFLPPPPLLPLLPLLFSIIPVGCT